MKLENINKIYDGKKIIDNLNLEIALGKITSIQAPSGAGKTTLVNIIAGLTKPDSGKVLDVPKPISMVFQEDRLLPWLTALENVELITDTKNAMEYLAKVELDGFEKKDVSKLSGGMQRRVSLARALASEYELLILDEPFTGLDLELQKRMLQLIKDELKGRTCIIISHDLNGLGEFEDCRYNLK